MSASARFLLEFQATGDQEVVNKIREVGTAGKETATDLQSLQGIEDPFSKVAQGAESAVAPVTEVGSATEGLGGIFGEAGTAGEEFSGALTSMNDSASAVQGGLTDANTAVGDLGSTTGSAVTGIGQMSGAIVGLGGTIGTAISTVYRMQDAQLALDKAHLKAAKSTESARKAEVGFDNLLKSATGNTQGITAARNELSAAQDALNQLQEQGITSGAEYEAAQARVGAATAALRGEFVQGGGDANKFDAAMNKVSLTQDAMTIAAKNLEKATREYGTTQLETGLAVAGFVGTAIQAVSSLRGLKEGAGTLSPLLAKVGKAIAGTTGAAKLLAAGIGALAIGFGGFIGVMTAIDQNVGGVKDALKGVHDQASKTVPALSGMFDYLGKTFATNTEGFGKWGAEVMKMLGIPVSEGPKAADGLKGVGDASTALGGAVVDTSAKLKGAMDATKGNTTAMGALQRTNAEAQISTENFNAAMAASKAEIDAGAGSSKTLTQSMYQLYGAMAQTTEQALTLSNLFPQMGSNISNALLGQKQGMTVAIQLWNDFTARVQDGQYEVGEFTKYIQDMGYELPPAIQGGVDAIDAMTKKIEDAKGTIPGYIDEVTAAITQGNQEMYDSGQLLEQNLSDEEKAVRALQQETSNATAEYLKNKNAKRDAAQASRDLAASLISEADSAANASEAIAESHLAYAKSVDAVADMNAVLGDQTAHQEAVDTAVNKTIESVKGEQIALEAAIKATQNKVIQDQKLTNAKLEGTKAAMEFISSLDEEKAKQEANIAVLRQSVDAMGQFGDTSLLTADQLQNLAEVAAGVPSAIRALAGEIGGLAQEATKFLEFAGEEDELFGNWKIADTVPDEIKDMMSQADFNFIEGRAQLERSLESLGPLVGVKFARAIQQGGEGGLAQLRRFGPEAADIIRQSGAEMDPAIQELVSAFDALGTVTGTTVVDAMARVVTAMKNVEDPAAGLVANLTKMANEGAISSQQLLDLAEAGVITSDALAQTALNVDGLAESTAGSAEGLNSLFGAMDAVAGQGKTLVLELDKLNKVSIEGVGNFVQVGDQLLPIGPAAQGAATGLGAMTAKINPLNAAIQAAGASMQQFGDYVGEFFQTTLPNIVSSHAITVNPLTGMITVSLASLDQFASAVGQKMAQIRQMFARGLGGVKQTGGGIPIQVNIAPAIRQLQSLKVQIGLVKQSKPTLISVNTAAATSAVNRLKSLVNSLPNIKRTITYSYRIVGSKPNPQNISRTITYRYRTVGTRPAQSGMHENLASDTLIAAHKGERVDISPHTINTNENRTAIIPASGSNARPINIMVRGDVNGKELIRFVKFNLMEGTGGVM